MQITVSLALSLLISVGSLAIAPTAASAQTPAAQPAAKMGVWANTDAGEVLLSAYYSGVSTSLPVGFQTHTVAVPKAKTLNSFKVQMPGVDASRIAVYYLNGLTEVWAGGQTPLKADIKSDGGALTVSSAEWNGRAPGFAILEIKADAAGIRKFYAVNLGKAAQAPGQKPTE
jgi:hypothetical protein